MGMFSAHWLISDNTGNYWGGHEPSHPFVEYSECVRFHNEKSAQLVIDNLLKRGHVVEDE